MRVLKLLTVTAIVLLVIYYQLDKRLFYYGKNGLPVYHFLPLTMIPDYRPWFEGGFELIDEDGKGFDIAGSGVGYMFNNKTVIINDVLGYGFNAKEVVAVVTDSSGMKYCVRIYSPPIRNLVGHFVDVDATMYPYDKINSFKLDKWIDVKSKNDKIDNISLVRNYVMLALIIMIPIFINRIWVQARKVISYKIKWPTMLTSFLQN